MEKKLVLIDGHSILNRAFYGIPDLTNSEGTHTNAVYGFLNILLKILGEEQPEYLTVAFDVKHPTFRHEMYKEYKGTRTGMPQELVEQVPIIKEILQAMKVNIVEMPGFEADDILGSYAYKAQEDGMVVSLISGDRDTLQIATDKIRIRIPTTRKSGTVTEDYYAKDVEEVLGVTPKEFIDVKALMGDPSDNIPGVPGIGKKTATALIQKYGSIEEAYAHVEEITPNRAKESLKENYKLAELSKDLATIRLKLDIDYDWEQAELHNIYTPAAYELCKKYEFKNLLSKFQTEECAPEGCGLISLEKSEFEQMIKKMENIDIVAFSAKMGEKKKGRSQQVILEIATKEEGYEYAVEYSEDAIQEIQLVLDQLLDLPIQKVSPNLKSMVQLFHIEDDCGIFDLKLAAYLVNPLKAEYEFTIMETIESYQQLKAQLEAMEMMELYKTIELPLLYVLEDMSKMGIQVQLEELKQFSEELQTRILELEKTIYEQAEEEFNINSPKQLGVILFEKLQLAHGKKTKTGYSTAADILEKLKVEAPIVGDILEYRQLSKLKSTYADGLGNFIGQDGRIHGIFHQTITATGRISSTEPNLQNIPIRMELGRKIRKAFVAKEGFVFIDADYSQIELRLLAHMSGDEALISAYSEAQDIHRMTASQVFHIPFEEVTNTQRSNAKAVNFGIVYGISAFGLSQDLEIPIKEAAEYIKRYFATYPKIKEFLDGLVEQAKKTGYSETLYGRRRPVPELSSSNLMQRSFGERIAMNSPIQGTAADIIKLAMLKVAKRLKTEKLESKLVLQVHDELLIEASKMEVEQVRKILQEEMGQVVQLRVPLEIDVHEGKNWYEAK